MYGRYCKTETDGQISKVAISFKEDGGGGGDGDLMYENVWGGGSVGVTERKVLYCKTQIVFQ